ncbi:MAG: hypothetical protein A4E44_02208 [Methanosaeta sp. PtaB.Bin018]|nr:hypothetical protein [Methanothrix sp.]OPX73993.1 MAG: hypothetical protein A4E44_02208 [Methanosaeta sp. PtaB.Bin018]OPY45618.1 MAG: hypothetical protein A4E46_01197 [Methanosaeta sp. PtaU1.Bin016]
MKTKIALLIVMIAALLTFQASAGCGRWVVRENTDYLKDPLFDEAVEESTGHSTTANVAGKTNNDEDNATSAEEKANAIDIAGKWRFKLQSDLESTLDLILIQSNDRLQGYGTLADRGSGIPATATGIISKDAVSLEVKLSREEKDYRLDLTLVNDTLEGSYELYEGDRLALKGNATANKAAA